MLPTSLLAPALALLLQATGPAGALDEPPGPFGAELGFASSERLLRYAWDGGAPVPYLAPGATPRLRLPFGERGLVPTARLYLPGNSLAEATFTGATLLFGRELALGPGRLGTGLSFGPSTHLRFALPPQASHEVGWTLSLWLRPEPAALGRRMLLLPGVVEIELQASGRPWVHLLPSGEALLHPLALETQAWSRLVVSYDPALTRQMRVMVDGAAECLRFASVAPSRTPLELQLGDLLLNGQGYVGGLDELVLEALPLSTDSVRRLAPSAAVQGEHRLELVTNLGLRSLEPVAAPRTELVLDTTADFAAGTLDGVVAEDGALVWVPARWRRVDTPRTPPPRTTHPTLAIGGGRVLVFGGETRDTEFGPNVNTSDTWIYDRATESWERVPTTTAPAPRCHVPAAYSPDHDLVLLAGGWKNDATPHVLYDDTWVFLVGERRWERRFPAGIALPAASDFGLVYLPAQARFALFSDTRVLLYDPLGDTWEERVPQAFTEAGLPTAYAVPGSAMCGVDPATGLAVIFGGHSGPTASIFHDTTALFDAVANTFTVLDPPQRPSARVRSGFDYDSEHALFVLFGGVRDQLSPRHDDLWTFDPATRLWSEIPCSSRPGPVGGLFGMAYDAASRDFVLFGGRESPNGWRDETQVLALRPAEPGLARYTLDRRQARHARQWFSEATTPGDSAVSFLFRTSRGGSLWTPWSPALALGAQDRFLQVQASLAPGSAGEVPSLQRMGLR